MAPGDTPDESAQWYLEVGGKKYGPYTLAQVQELARHHEILPQDKVTSVQMQGQWVSVGEFIQQKPAEAPQTAQAVPPRPVTISSASPMLPSSDPAVAHDLFDILQSAKERKANAAAAVPTPPANAVPSHSPSGTRGMRLLGAFLVLACITIGAIRFLGKSEAPPTRETPARPAVAPAGFATAPAKPAAVHDFALKSTTLRKRQVTPTTAAKPIPARETQAKARPYIPPHERPAGYVPTTEDLDHERDMREQQERREREAADARQDFFSDVDRDRDRDRDRDIDSRYDGRGDVDDRDERDPGATPPRIPPHELVQPASQVPPLTDEQQAPANPY